LSPILLVDGDATYRTGLRDALRHLGHPIRLAGSIRELLETLPPGSPDSPTVIVLDWFLPDGVAAPAIHRLREAGITAPILVLVAAEAFDRVRLPAEQGGATLVLNKAMSRLQVRRIVDRLLCVPSSAAEALHLGRNTVCRLEYPYPATALPPAQAGLLRVLLDQPPGEFVPATKLASRLIVYAYRTDAARLVAQRVSRLRSQIAPLGVRIESRRGQGYRLVLAPLPPPSNSA